MQNVLPALTDRARSQWRCRGREISARSSTSCQLSGTGFCTGIFLIFLRKVMILEVDTFEHLGDSALDWGSVRFSNGNLAALIQTSTVQQGYLLFGALDCVYWCE